MGALVKRGRANFKMRGVISYFTNPRGRLGWDTKDDFDNSWRISSTLLNRRCDGDTWLITDTPGKAYLIGELGLKFGRVSTDLDGLINDPRLWNLAKIRAYQLQTSPFVHIDHDTFLWNGLPDPCRRSGLFAQSPEHFFRDNRNATFYNVDLLSGFLRDKPAWFDVAERSTIQNPVNMGIVGGHDVEFFQRYAQAVFDLLDSQPEAWRAYLDSDRGGASHVGGGNLIIEQWTFGAMLTAENKHVDFCATNFNPQNPNSKELGYTHLLADAKRDSYWKRVMNESASQLFV